MPPRTPKACRVRGCRSTTTDPSGYCESHKSEGWKQYKPGQSRHQRGYGSKWDAIRERVLKRDKGLCQLCLRAGVVREAKTVDHIIPKAHGGTDADSNLQSLCWPCHKAKTAPPLMQLRIIITRQLRIIITLAVHGPSSPYGTASTGSADYCLHRCRHAL